MSKKIFIGSLAVIAIFGLIACNQQKTPASNQTTSTVTTNSNPNPTTPMDKSSTVGIIMTDNKMIAMMKDDSAQALKETVTLSNGTKIAADGSVTTPEGIMMKFIEGSTMDMDGTLSTHGVWILKLTDPSISAITFKDGKMYLIQNGKMIMMQNPLMINNGSTVEMDGGILPEKGDIIQMKNGQSVTMDGTLK